MKRLYALFFAFGMLLAFTVHGQNGAEATVDIADVTKFPGTVEVPIYVDFSEVNDGDTDGVASFEFSISFDSAVISGVLTPTNYADGIDEDNVEFDSAPGEFKINWEGMGTPLTTEGKLFDMVFIYEGDYSDISFEDTGVEGETELGYVNGDPITNVLWADGSITERTAPIPVSQWALFIGFGLIGIFIVIRAIRIF